MLVADFYKAGNYWETSYYEGYFNGLVFIGICDRNPDAIQEFPLLYLPKNKRKLNVYDIYERAKKISSRKNKYAVYARKMIDNLDGVEMVLHHPPY